MVCRARRGWDFRVLKFLHKENNLSNPTNPIKLIPFIKLFLTIYKPFSRLSFALQQNLFQPINNSSEPRRKHTYNLHQSSSNIYMEMEKQVIYENDDLHLNLRLGLPGSDDTQNKTTGTKRASSQLDNTEIDDQDSSPPPSK